MAHMPPKWQVEMTLPPKDEPYTQHDMDVVIGHPVNLEMNVDNAKGISKMPLVGTITAAEIQPDGSALVTMEVTTA